MLLLDQKISQKHKVSPIVKIKQPNSPHIKSWKIAYRATRKNKLINLFQDISKQNSIVTTQKKYEPQQNYTEPVNKSSYQLYKQKQKETKIKLQEVHSPQKPRPSVQKFYCTLRVRQSRIKRRTSMDKNKDNSQQLNLGTLNTIRSQIHQRQEAKRQFIKTPRECMTHHTNRKIFMPRKYSLDNNVASFKSKFLQRNISFVNKICFNASCRPWSPADLVQSGFITQGQINII